jgi:Phage integrase family
VPAGQGKSRIAATGCQPLQWRQGATPLIADFGSCEKNDTLNLNSGKGKCRHTFASLLIDAGENPKAIQAFMGHATIQMTFDRYGHDAGQPRAGPSANGRLSLGVSRRGRSGGRPRTGELGQSSGAPAPPGAGPTPLAAVAVSVSVQPPGH